MLLFKNMVAKTLKDISNILNLDTPWCKYVKTKKNNGPRYTINDWSLYDHTVRTNNSTEVYNKHHCSELGTAPTINKFIKWVLELFETSIINFNSNQRKKYLSVDNVNNGIHKKDSIIQKYKNVNTFIEFNKFSKKLTEIRRFCKYGNMEIIESDCCIDKSFSDNSDFDDISDSDWISTRYR